MKNNFKIYNPRKRNEIGKILGCSYCLVQSRLKNLGYKLRSASEAHILRPSQYWLGKKLPDGFTDVQNNHTGRSQA